MSFEHISNLCCFVSIVDFEYVIAGGNVKSLPIFHLVFTIPNHAMTAIFVFSPLALKIHSQSVSKARGENTKIAVEHLQLHFFVKNAFKL